MKIYVAARFAERHLVEAAHTYLRNSGHEISYDWTQHKENWPETINGQPFHGSNPAYARQLSEADLKGIRDSDAFLLLYESDFGRGKFVELGYALGLNKKCFVLMKDDMSDCIFFYHSGIKIIKRLYELPRGK